MPKEITNKDYSTKTIKTLHTTGVLHVEESEELKPVDKEAIDKH
jgi:vacuolar-type H+-ATPase subunit I/STV1